MKNEKPQHRVRITKPFYLGVYPVTWAEYQRVMAKNQKNHSQSAKKDYPIKSVSWSNAQEFCDRLSQQEGLSYRLPTEAEWEYACRAGSTGRWCFGDDKSLLKEYAWYGFWRGCSLWRLFWAYPVGQKKPNVWGLYDMHGNVYEWCSDWWSKTYYKEFAANVAVDPAGPAKGSYRVYRGGSWLYDASGCRSASRSGLVPGYRYDYVGFRLARTVSSPSR